MEQKYIVSLSGNILRDSMEETIESLSSIFLDKQPTEIESLIRSKATIKRAVDLNLANKIKSRMEQAGVECIIAIDSTPPTTTPTVKTAEVISKSPEPNTKNSYKHEGAIYISISIALTFVLLLISSGYDPRGGFFWSLTNSMYLYSGYPFCEGTPPYNVECYGEFNFSIKTKHALILLIAILTYGIGRYKNYFNSVGYYVKKVTRIFN
ncbi:hypothetical protein [Pseudomonas sp. XK-1]|uniref:hypothetical protein n=1 Tax=Pseudomonas sp. XK-1 TaxID=3136019 RepID=UPI003119FEAB